VCFFWGTTYIAIKVGVREMPPLMFSGVRFFLAGLLLSAFCLATGRRFPTARDRGPLAFAAVLMMCVANGVLAWALQYVPSGVASLLIALTPLWLVVLASAGGERVPARGWAGVAVELAAWRSSFGPTCARRSSTRFAWRGQPCCSTGVWAWSSLYQKRRPHGADPFAAVAFQKLVGGAAAVLLGLAFGEGPRWHPQADGLWALLYLTFAGSVVGYTAYLYALAHLPTERVAMYAYVNPLVAVSLGILWGGEAADPHLLAGAPVVLLGVWLAGTAPTAKAEAASAEAAL
jgi:drug/metabolite transporter (DMT)-like permease